MAQASTVSTPQRGVVGVQLSQTELQDLADGLTVRVPNGRYFIDISAPVDSTDVADEVDDPDVI